MDCGDEEGRIGRFTSKQDNEMEDKFYKSKDENSEGVLNITDINVVILPPRLSKTPELVMSGSGQFYSFIFCLF